MRFDFSRFLLDIERRFRRLRGLSLSCRLLFYGSIACVVLCLGLLHFLWDGGNGRAYRTY